MFSRFFKSRKHRSLEDQIRILDECGVHLCPGITIEDFLCSFPRKSFEGDPFTHTYSHMGIFSELDPPGRRISDNVWHFDAECIYGDGDYVAIADRLRVLAQGELPLKSVRDRIDDQLGVSWLDNQKIRLDLELSDDWVDGKVFSHFAQILKLRGATRQFTYLSSGGQDCMIGFCTPDEFAKLRKETGLDLLWQE